MKLDPEESVLKGSPLDPTSPRQVTEDDKRRGLVDARDVELDQLMEGEGGGSGIIEKLPKPAPLSPAEKVRLDIDFTGGD